MSVNYESALIYGWDCSKIQEDWPLEATERMEELGFDVIRDCYSEEFLYIGKCISHTSCGEEARVDCLRYLEQMIYWRLLSKPMVRLSIHQIYTK